MERKTSDMREIEARHTFILVHGAWHGAWCWHRLVDALGRHGAEAIAVDLPGHGARLPAPKPLGDITQDEYVQAVVDAIDACPGRITLVGHSLGGISVSLAAERRSERIERSVYVAGIMLRSGQTAAEMIAADTGSGIPRAVVRDPEARISWLKADEAVPVFYQDCPVKDIAFASTHLVKEPALPGRTPLLLSDARYGRVARHYILCEQDRAISPAMQARFIGESPCRSVLALDSGHSPFFSQPQRLADLLVSLVPRALVVPG